MNLWSKIGQTFSAFLNVLPATVAVTYILSTGDPVGAAGIKVKLSGLFGLKDLYALVALPATSGLRTADQAQLEALMGPIAETWLNHKLEVIQTIFQDTISGETLAKAERIYSEADRHIADLNRVLANCRTYKNYVDESANADTEMRIQNFQSAKLFQCCKPNDMTRIPTSNFDQIATHSGRFCRSSASLCEIII